MKEFFEQMAEYFRVHCPGALVRTPFEAMVADEEADQARISLELEVAQEMILGNCSYELAGDLKLRLHPALPNGDDYLADFEDACRQLKKEALEGSSYHIYEVAIEPVQAEADDAWRVSRASATVFIQL